MQKLTHGFETTVAQMVNVIYIADLIYQTDDVVDGGHDVLGNNCLDVHIGCPVPDNLDRYTVSSLDDDTGDARLLYLLRLTAVDPFTGLNENFTRVKVYNGLHDNASDDTGHDTQLLVGLVTTDPREIVPLRIVEQSLKQRARALLRRRLSGA